MNSDYRRYSGDDVSEIVRAALSRRNPSTTVSHDELLETAREMGVSETEVEAAIHYLETEHEFEAAKAKWIHNRKQKFWEHVRTYLIVNGFLFGLDFFVPGPPWFYWVLFGWGIGLAFDASEAFFPSDKKVEQGARRMIKRQRRSEMQAV